MGTYINLRDSRVYNFTVALDKGYNLTRPHRTSSCVTNLGRQPVYVETGGAFFDEASVAYGTNKGVFTMDVLGPDRLQHQQHQLVRAAGGDVIPKRAQAALACGPDGQVRSEVMVGNSFCIFLFGCCKCNQQQRGNTLGL
jgi:hypothetical protein